MYRGCVRHKKYWKKIVGNESIDLEVFIYLFRLAEASSVSEDPPFPPNLCTDTSVEQNSSSS